MARYQFDDKDGGASVAAAAGGLLDALVRLAGLVLLCVGLVTAVAIIKEAWLLYKNPKSGAVERFARAIDDSSHLDKILSPKRLAAAADAGTRADAGAEPGSDAAAAPAASAAKPPAPLADTDPADQLQLSYFVAWAILMLVMLLVGRLSIAAIKTGGELALHDVQIKRFARELLREMDRGRER